MSKRTTSLSIRQVGNEYEVYYKKGEDDKGRKDGEVVFEMLGCLGELLVNDKDKFERLKKCLYPDPKTDSLPAPLSPISDTEIIQQLQMGAPHGFDWTPTSTELKKAQIIRDAQLAADRKAMENKRDGRHITDG